MTRRNYHMTEEQYTKLMSACKPTPVIMVGDAGLGRSPQQSANSAWQALGKELGFDWKTVVPLVDARDFSAEPLVMKRVNKNHIDIVFDGPPVNERVRFVDVEDENGVSVSAGEWIKRADDSWVLRIHLKSELDAATKRVYAHEIP